jgi:hypothetical protein
MSLQMLLLVHVATCCISLACVATLYLTFHIFYHPDGLYAAAAVVAAFATVSIVFVFAEFSFGYFVGFHIYTVIVGYLWLNCFSEFGYNHYLTGLSAATSGIAFLLPALFIRGPLRRTWTMSPAALNRSVNLILLLAAVTLAVGANYNFRLVGVGDIYSFRDTLTSPTILNYLMAILSSALLPFAFACFVEGKSHWRAGAVLLLLACFYPITLSKLALFTPVWLVIVLLFSRRFDSRVTVILSLLVPMIFGVILYVLVNIDIITYRAMISYFGLVNLRMIAIPSLAMDYYNEFFFKHELTYFCQIGFIKPLFYCPYREQISVVINNAFGVGGNFNASLLATEGIASVGTLFAPVAALAGGLVIGLGNRLSEGLSQRFVLISGAALVPIVTNVPFSTVLLTHGAAILFLFWYVMPRPLSNAG